MPVAVAQHFASAANAPVNRFLPRYNLTSVFLSGIKKELFLRKCGCCSSLSRPLEGVVPGTPRLLSEPFLSILTRPLGDPVLRPRASKH